MLVGGSDRRHDPPPARRSVSLLDIVVGIYVTGIIRDFRIVDLPASQYAAMHQMRDKTFRRIMPVVGLTVFA